MQLIIFEKRLQSFVSNHNKLPEMTAVNEYVLPVLVLLRKQKFAVYYTVKTSEKSDIRFISLFFYPLQFDIYDRSRNSLSPCKMP